MSKQLTAFAAQFRSAAGMVAQDGSGVYHVVAAVRTRVGRAERVAALGLLAGVLLALHLVGVVDLSIAVWAAGRAAVHGKYFVVSFVCHRAKSSNIVSLIASSHESCFSLARY